jgi:hypothetical protein
VLWSRRCRVLGEVLQERAGQGSADSTLPTTGVALGSRAGSGNLEEEVSKLKEQ